MAAPLKLEDFKRGSMVAFEWSHGATREFARENNIRALGKVVTQEDLPQMKSTAVAIQLLDDPTWVIDPAFAIAKGKTFFLANSPSASASAIPGVTHKTTSPKP
jgi:hypothetical protein